MPKKTKIEDLKKQHDAVGRIGVDLARLDKITSVQGCKCKETLIAALDIRGDMSKGEKDRVRDLINKEMK